MTIQCSFKRIYYDKDGAKLGVVVDLQTAGSCLFVLLYERLYREKRKGGGEGKEGRR